MGVNPGWVLELLVRAAFEHEGCVVGGGNGGGEEREEEEREEGGRRWWK